MPAIAAINETKGSYGFVIERTQGVMDGKFVAYYRVSTDKQDAECPAQRAAVETWLNGGKHELLGEFVEVETGKNNARPALAAAMTLCRKRKATLVIAKLDRLSCNLHFITGLMEGGVKFVALRHATRQRL